MNKKLFSIAIVALLLSLYAEKTHAQASGTKPELFMYRHNGSSSLSPLPAATGNTIGTLQWRALTALNAVKMGATIKSVATNVAPNVLHANLFFATSDATGLKDKMVITPEGLVGIGELNPTYFNLHVKGNTHTTGRFHGRIHYDVGEATDLPGSYNDESYFERKSRAQLGLAANPYTNGGILSLAPGGGSLDRQLFSGGDDGLWTRSQNLAGTDAWATWEKILTSGDINGRPNLVARFLPPGPLSSKLSDGQLFDNGANVVIGGIPAAPAVPAPVFDPADMLTVKGNLRTDGNLRATGNGMIDGNASVNGATSTGSLSVNTHAVVNGNTTTDALNVITNTMVGGNTNTNSLNVTTNALIHGNTNTNSLNVTNNATVTGNVGIGKAPSTFDLDVAGSSNFDGRVKIGATSFPTATSYELAVGGGVIAEEVLVQLEGAWADYVFADNYELKSLNEVENFIAREKHLPGVISAKEVAENGLNLGAMQKAQMEKIEELYLHMIAMDKAMNALKAENETMKATIEQLKQRN